VKRPYFCQNNILGKGHKSRYFANIEDARQWLSGNGGGTIKKRNHKIIHASGYGLGRVVFGPPLRVWGEIETVEAKG
jgi:hypothetical protein